MSKHTSKLGSWPITIKKGSVAVRIYRTPENGRDRFTIEWSEAGARKRLTRVDLAEAKTLAKETAARLDDGQGAALVLTGAEREAYQHAVRKLKPLGIGLATAIEEFVDAKAVGAPLLAAAKAYHKTHMEGLPPKAIAEIVEELIAAKKADGLAKTYLAPLRTCLGHFARDIKGNIADIPTQILDAWLRGLDLSVRSRNNHRNAVVLLFNFAKKAGYLNRDLTTAAEHTSLARSKKTTPPIYLPQEFAKLLAHATPNLLPALVLGGFCGLRAVEIARLDWSAIHWSESTIIIPVEGSKQGEAARRRIAPLTVPAAAWLADYRAMTGKVLPLDASDFYAALKPVFEEVEVNPRGNGLRHSFITYRVAMTKDFVKTAYEAGNSVAKIQSNYDAVATEAEGNLWFAVMPHTPANVLEMATASR